MLHDKIPCKFICSTDFGNGTLYAMVFQTRKTYTTLDNAITELDTGLLQGRMGTNFVSITNVLSGKIKTLASGEHKIDEHYKAIFKSDNPGGGRRLIVKPNVHVWTPEKQLDVYHPSTTPQIEKEDGETPTIQEDTISKKAKTNPVLNATSELYVLSSESTDQIVQFNEDLECEQSSRDSSISSSFLEEHVPNWAQELTRDIETLKKESKAMKEYDQTMKHDIEILKRDNKALRHFILHSSPDTEEIEAGKQRKSGSKSDSLSIIAEQYASDTDNSVIHDESSSDNIEKIPGTSCKSVSNAVMNSYARKVIKEFSKEWGSTLKEAKENTVKLLEETQARDFLVAQNLKQSDEIEEHKLKRKIQEGKTSYQTRKANNAMQMEIQAQRESISAKAKENEERQRREVFEAEKGALIITNANLSSSIRHISTGNQVCIKHIVMYLSQNTYSATALRVAG